MAAGDNLGINPGTGAAVTADLVTRTGDAAASLTQFIKILDGTDGSINALIVGTEGAARVKDVGVSTSAVNGMLTLNSGSWAAARVGGTNLAGRTILHVQNDSDVSFEVGFSNVSPLGFGTRLPSGQSMSFNLADTLTLYVQPVSGASKRCNIIEAN